jgi:hypothetical protein
MDVGSSQEAQRSPLVTFLGGLAIFLGIGVVGTSIGFGFAVLSEKSISGISSLFVSSEPVANEQAAEEFAPPFIDWPEQKPDLALAITGEMFGYMRPCGCSPGQHGGLSRRGGLLRSLQERNWTVVPVDFGDLIAKATPWEQLRYFYSLETLQDLGYPVVGLGAKDLAISMTEVLGNAMNVTKTSVVDASLRHVDKDFQSILEEGIKPAVVFERDGIKVGVGHVIGDALAGDIKDPSVELQPCDEVTHRLLEKMKTEGAELKLLFAYMPMKDAIALAEKHPGFDLVVCQSTYEDALSEEAKFVGDTMVTWVGQKGKKVGVVGYWRDQKPRLRFEMLPVDLRYEETPTVDELYARYVAQVKAGGFVEKVPKVAHPTKDTFAGAEKCGECHKRAYAKWKTTGHAHALETLEKKAVPAGQDYNPECVICHTTGFQFTGGFVSAEITPTLGGNQCENCHGPGKAHVDDPKNADLALRMRKSEHQIEAECRKCHDAENSLHFNFQEYWPKVKHPWRD